MPNSVEIGWRTQLTTESRPWAIDMSPEMDSGDAITSVTAALTDLLTGLSYPTGLTTGATYSGTVVTQNVASLQAGHNYRLVVTANMGGTKQSSSVLLLNVPY